MINSFRNSKLFNKHKSFIKITFFFDWEDFGFVFRLYKTAEFCEYKKCLDIIF